VGDSYLAATGFDAQQTDEPEDPGRPHNLWEPVAGDAGAHGRFDLRASESSTQWQLTKMREPLTAVGLLVLGAASAILGWTRARG
jgi:hypothetical protein